MLAGRVSCRSTIAIVLIAGDAFAQPSAVESISSSEIRTAPPNSAASALESLLNSQTQGESVFVDQKDLDPLIEKGGGGACPSAAAIIVYQLMRMFAAQEPDNHPHRAAIAAFAENSALLQGRLTNLQFVDLLRFYGARLEGADVEISVLSARNSPYAQDGNRWGTGKSPDLRDKPDVIRILSYTVTTTAGSFLGRHFVVQRSFRDGELRVVDPNALQKDYRFRVENDSDGMGRVFLRFPAGKNLPVVNEVNTVFEVKVHRLHAKRQFTPTESSPIDRIQNEIDALAARLATSGELRSPRKWRKEGSRFGLPALDLPAEFGGANWSAEKTLEVFRHAGRHDLNLRDVVGGAHGRVLLGCRSPEVRDIVQQVADGEAYIAIAITEPDAGSDYTAMTSKCVKVDGGYRLNGVKRFNARLNQATHVIVFTKSDSGKPRRLNVFILPIDADGLRIEEFKAHGLTGNSYGGLVMDDVFVPESHLIGNEDDGYHVFNEHFRYWRLMQGAAALGTAERALELMADRLKTRRAFGGPIGRFTHLQQPLGEYTIKLKMAHSLAKEAAQKLDRGQYDEADVLISGLKAEGVEIALGAVDAATRAFGGEGYSDLVDLGDRLRDLNGLRIADGTTDVMRSSVVAKVYGKEFWEMAIERRE